ncbi:MAG: MFS transporter [Candidatus Helarchaeota archaeon]
MKKDILILYILILFSSALTSLIVPLRDEIYLALYLASRVQIDFINAIFLIIGASCSIIWAILGDYYSRKRLLMIGTFVWSIFSLITAFAFDFSSLLIFQIFSAIGFGSALPLTFSLLVDLVKKERRATAFGRLSAIYVLGNGVGLILATLSEVETWFVPFMLVAIGGIGCALFLIFMKEPRIGTSSIQIENSGIDDESVIGMSYKIKLSDFKMIIDRHSIITLILFNFMMFISIGAWAPQFSNMLETDYLAPYEPYSSIIATFLMVFIYGSQMISGPVIGQLADKKYKKDKLMRMKFVLICILIGSVSLIIAYSLIFNPLNLPLLIFFFIMLYIGTFFFGGIDPLTQATLGDVSPPQIKSTVYSLNFIAYTFGRSLSLIFFGFLYIIFEPVYRPSYLILSICALICSIFPVIILKLLKRDLKDIQKKYKEQ